MNIWTPALVALIIAAGPVLAGEDLARKHGCAACHAVDKKMVGPSWKAIAGKYKGTPEAAQLEAKVRAGGKGVWGTVAMPPQDKIGEADLKAVLAWVLSL